jgi:kinetochore protein Mis12/MTW1
MSAPIGLPKAVPPILLPEILGFSPQLFLDDIINSANTAVTDAVNAMEEFLQRWADQRAEKHKGDWDGTQEVEQGLIAFQTLLEYHTDVAFDFFEAWSLRNIFTFPSDLPVIVPHQAGLDLEHSQERERECADEIASLRKEIENVRVCFSPHFKTT